MLVELSKSSQWVTTRQLMMQRRPRPFTGRINGHPHHNTTCATMQLASSASACNTGPCTYSAHTYMCRCSVQQQRQKVPVQRATTTTESAGAIVISPSSVISTHQHQQSLGGNQQHCNGCQRPTHVRIFAHFRCFVSVWMAVANKEPHSEIGSVVVEMTVFGMELSGEEIP